MVQRKNFLTCSFWNIHQIFRERAQTLFGRRSPDSLNFRFSVQCFHSTDAFINLPFLLTRLSIPQNGKMPLFWRKTSFKKFFSISLMPPNSAIKCLGNTPGECSYTVLNVGFWKIHPFPMNNQLALKLKIQVTLKDSSFLGLQPSYLVYEIFYKPLYEFNLNGCNSFNTSLLNTKLQSWCLVLKKFTLCDLVTEL